jgi:hypothetical protein
MSGEVWYVIFLAVVLKIPIVGLGLTIWWAIKQTPDADFAEGPDDDGFRRRPRQPRRPRGPHGSGPVALPACPPGGRPRIAAGTVCADRERTQRGSSRAAERD